MVRPAPRPSGRTARVRTGGSEGIPRESMRLPRSARFDGAAARVLSFSRVPDKVTLRFMDARVATCECGCMCRMRDRHRRARGFCERARDEKSGAMVALDAVDRRLRDTSSEQPTGVARVAARIVFGRATGRARAETKNIFSAVHPPLGRSAGVGRAWHGARLRMRNRKSGLRNDAGKKTCRSPQSRAVTCSPAFL